jgi:hypothetical protein
MWIASQDDSLEDNVHGVAFGQSSLENGSRLDLARVQGVDPEGQEGAGRKVVVVVEGTEVMVVIVFSDVLGVLGLFGAVDEARIDWLNQQSLEAKRDHDEFTRVYPVFSLVKGILLDLAVQNGHLSLVFQQERKHDWHVAQSCHLLRFEIFDGNSDIEAGIGESS